MSFLRKVFAIMMIITRLLLKSEMKCERIVLTCLNLTFKIRIFLQRNVPPSLLP